MRTGPQSIYSLANQSRLLRIPNNISPYLSRPDRNFFTPDKNNPPGRSDPASVPSLEPTDRRVIDVVGKRDLTQRLTGYHALQRFARLVLRTYLKIAEGCRSAISVE